MIRTLLNIAVSKNVSIAPLITFRVFFGLLMFVSTVRFFANDWIAKQFVEPAFHFKYFGFHWVPDFSEHTMYVLFIIMAISALGVAFGAFYRWSTILFFLSFTSVELVDATYYLNHYYFVSLVALIMIFLPANRLHSVDVKLGRIKSLQTVPAWTVNIIKFQLGLVYFMAGVAKLNFDWLFNAMPLAIWLPAQSEFPIIGTILTFKATAFAMSWAGALYDLSIPFILLSKKWRPLGFMAVIAFHLLTWSFFQIGMFPFIMIGSTLIFFSADWHQKLHQSIGLIPSPMLDHSNHRLSPWSKSLLIGFAVFQLLFPFRHLLYEGNLYWHEQGYRFGWRVMLVEKAGYAQFKVWDDNDQGIWVANNDFLTPVQEKMMSTQSDFMIQYARFLEDHYTKQGLNVQKVTADVFVTMNGSASRRFIPNDLNLAALKDSWANKDWIVEHKNELL